MKTPNNTQRHPANDGGRAGLALAAGALAVLLCGLSTPLPSQTVTWNGSASNDWFTAGNWSGGAVPTASNEVRINSGTGPGPELTSGTAFAAAFNVAQSGSGVFTMGGNAELVTTAGQIGTAANTSGRVVMSGNSLWRLAGSTGVYLGLSGTGRLEMSGNATISAPGFMSLGRNGSGQGFVTMSGNARIAYANSFFIGDGASATGTGTEVGVLAMSGSSQIAGTGNGDVTIGRNINNSGTLTMSQWAEWRTPRDMLIGENGRASVLLSGSSLLAARHAYLGNAAAGIGSVTVRDDATFSLTGNLIVGNSNQGVLTLENGGFVQANSLTLAQGATAAGTLYITGTKAGVITRADAVTPLEITGGVGSAKVVFNHTDSAYEFANDLTGSLSVEHTGAGCTELTGNNTYTGATLVSSGTLAGSAASLRGNITNNATVEFKVAAAATNAFSGIMDGNGILSKAGAGTLELNGSHASFTGVVRVREGILRLDSLAASTVSFIQLAGGTYDGNWTPGAGQLLAGAGTITGNVSLTNATLGVGGDPYITGILTIGGNLVMDNATLTFGCGAGGLSDTINLLGTLTLSGANTIDVTPRSSGMNTYNLGNIGALASARLTVNGAETVSGGSPRQSAFLYASGGDLMLDVNSDISRALTWTGGADAVWNYTGSNWTGSESTAHYAPGDTVIFSGTADAANPARRTITLGAGPQGISDMLVTGNADYTFAGAGGISAAAEFAAMESGNPNGLTSPSGKLLKSGPNTLVFENTGGNNFAGGIEIAGGAVVFNRADQLGTTNGMEGDSGIQFIATGTLVANAANMTLPNKIIIAPGATATLDTQSHNLAYSGAFDAASAGTFVKRGDGTLAVTGGIRAENVELAQGKLHLAPAGAIFAGNMLVGDGAVLLGGGTITLPGPGGTFSNRGNIMVGRAAGAATFGSMSITGSGNYAGDGGKIWLDLALSDDLSRIEFDKFIITGNATGITLVSLQMEPDPNPLPDGVSLPPLSASKPKTIGGITEPEPIITVSGSMAPGAFKQDGAVEFGGIQYIWNESRRTWVADTSDPARAMACMDASAILIGKASFDSLQRRLMFTRAREGGASRKMEAWLGGMTRNEKLCGSIYKNARSDTKGVQAGLDWAGLSKDGGLTFGLYCDYVETDMKLSGNAARTSTDATGAGMYLSWTRGPWYVEAMLRRAREHYGISPRLGGDLYTRGTSYGGSVASGLLLDFGRAWRVEPQVQLAWQRHRIDPVSDTSTRVPRNYKVDSADSLDGRASVRLWRDILFAQGSRMITPYARAGWSHEFKGESNVTVSQATFASKLSGGVLMFDTGAEMRLARNWSCNAALALFDGARTSGYSLDAGIRYAW